MSTTKTKAPKKVSSKHENLSPVYHLIREEDRGVTNCPHCGARGRYVRTFICEDGTTKEAMRGCYQKWPKSELMPVLVAESRNRAEKATLRGKIVASWDRLTLEADEKFRLGHITFDQLRQEVSDQGARRNAWVRRRDAELIAERNGTASPAQAMNAPVPETPSVPRSAPPATLESREYPADIFAPRTPAPRPVQARTNSAANPKTFSYLDRIHR